MTQDRQETALRSALGLCDYLIRHWPEVGSLPSVMETRQELVDALAGSKRAECLLIKCRNVLQELDDTEGPCIALGDLLAELGRA